MGRGGQITGISGSTQTARYEVTVTQVADKVALDVAIQNATAITVVIPSAINITQTAPITVNVTNNINITQTVALTVNVTNTITVAITSTSTLFTYEQALISGSYSVISITSTAVVEITAITNQALLEIYPLSTPRVYWAFTSAITPSSVASFRKIAPFIRPCKNSIFVMVTASGGINLATYKWMGL